MTVIDANIAAQPTSAPRRRMPARLLMSDAELAEVRTRRTWRSLFMIGHAWAVILGAIAVVAWWPNPVTALLAIAVIGSRQLGLAILMHEGAHGLLARDERLNMRLSQWLCAYPVLAETRAYRRYHLQHHAHTQTEEDPDLVLSAPFPITHASYRRKFVRDITGQTGFEQRKAQFVNARGDRTRPLRWQMTSLVGALGPQLAVQALLFAGFAAAGVWWAYPLLWLLPLLTWYQVVTRIRNIAEHAVVPDSADPLRNTRTTIANLLERAFVAPYFVNYHLEHHLLFYVPAYNLPRVHAILAQGPFAGRIEVERGYRAVLAKATARPASDDHPDAMISAAKRRKAAGRNVEDQARGGF